MGRKLRIQDMCTEKVPGSTRQYWATLRFTGKGPAFINPEGTRLILYDEDTVDAWLEGSTRISTSAKVSA